MSGYSVDVRERVIQTRQEGKTQAWIAQTFKISVSSVKRYLERFERTGRVEAGSDAAAAPTAHHP